MILNKINTDTLPNTCLCPEIDIVTPRFYRCMCNLDLYRKVSCESTIIYIYA